MKNEEIMLEECPFCEDGGDPQLIISSINRYKYVGCEKCLARGPHSVNEEYAIEWWNRRFTDE